MEEAPDGKSKDESSEPILNTQSSNVFDLNGTPQPVVSSREYMKRIFYRIRNSKFFIPILAVIAFVGGYYSFTIILNLELQTRQLYEIDIYSPRGLLFLAAIEHVFLGLAAFVFFIASRKYYLPLFIYAGFLISYMNLIGFSKYIRSETSFAPIIIYALAGIVLTIGFRFGKKLGVLAIIVNILLLANYNTKIFTGNYLHLKDIFYSAKSEPTQTNPGSTPVSIRSVTVKNLPITEKKTLAELPSDTRIFRSPQTEVFNYDIIFQNAGQDVFYIRSSADENNFIMSVMHNNQVIGGPHTSPLSAFDSYDYTPFPITSSLFVSPVGIVAYTIVLGEKEGFDLNSKLPQPKQAIVLDGSIGKLYDDIDTTSLRWNSEGTIIRYLATDSNRNVEVFNTLDGQGNIIEKKPNILFLPLKSEATSAYTFDENSYPIRIIDGVLYYADREITKDLISYEAPFLIDDGRLLVYSRANNSSYVVGIFDTTNNQQKEYEYPNAYVGRFIHSGKNLAYTVKTDKEIIVVNGVSYPENYTEVWPIEFLSDSKYITYVSYEASTPTEHGKLERIKREVPVKTD